MESSLLVAVPSAKPLVRWTRLRFDTGARRGLPPHVTVLYPFVSPRDLSESVIAQLRDIFADSPPFTFSLTEVAWFGDSMAYLTPEPSRPFEDLTWRVLELFPEYPPYRGAYGTRSVVPHLTLGKRERPAALQRAARRAEKGLPIQATAREVLLMARGPRSSTWRVRQVFPLGGRSGTSAYC